MQSLKKDMRIYKQGVKEARSALQEAILPEVPDMVVVEQKITALEQAIAEMSRDFKI